MILPPLRKGGWGGSIQFLNHFLGVGGAGIALQFAKTFNPPAAIVSDVKPPEAPDAIKVAASKETPALNNPSVASKKTSVVPQGANGQPDKISLATPKPPATPQAKRTVVPQTGERITLERAALTPVKRPAKTNTPPQQVTIQEDPATTQPNRVATAPSGNVTGTGKPFDKFLFSKLRVEAGYEISRTQFPKKLTEQDARVLVRLVAQSSDLDGKKAEDFLLYVIAKRGMTFEEFDGIVSDYHGLSKAEIEASWE